MAKKSKSRKPPKVKILITGQRGGSCQGWTKEEGELLEDLDRPFIEILGTKYARHLTPNAKKITYGDLLRIHAWAPPTPNGPEDPFPKPSKEFRELTSDDVHSIAEAIEAKTGRRYPEGQVYGSCTCVP